MTRYFFNLRDGYAGYVDRTGVELADDEAAREHACVVATELIKNREIKARHWRIAVQDEGGRQLFEISFMTFDRTLQKLSPPAKEAMDKLSERRCALGEAIAE